MTIWVGLGFGQTYLMPTTFLWRLCLIAAMLLMAWQAAVGGGDAGDRPPSTVPADD